LGSGSFQSAESTRVICEITKNAVSSKSKCSLLYNLVRYFNSNSVLELGTSLGVSTLYLSAALPDAEIITIEGDLSIIGIASSHECSWAENIRYINGSFDQAMDKMISEDQKVDLIYIDGSHNSKLQEGLLPYYKGLSHKGTVWIIDDIYWSSDMTTWWETIKKDTEFNIAIDMYHFGILYNNSSILEKIDKKILPKKARWKSGLTRTQN